MTFRSHRKILMGFCVGLAMSHVAIAQFTIYGQVRTRTEYRNGQGTLQKETDKPAFFTSQRTRLGVSYAGYRVKAQATLQDVRVWGQDASTINRTTNADLNGLMLHEAWAEISLLDTTQTKLGKEFALKVGRQELVYDDVRLLGNLDWLQQARRHDVALLKYSAKGWMTHLGIAYNQNRELKAGTIFNGIPTGYSAGTNGIGLAYKSLQFLYLGRKFKTGNASFLIIKDDFNKYATTPASTSMPGGTVAATRTNTTGTWSRVTFGSYVNATFKKLNLKAEAYYQTGKDKDGRSMGGYLLSGAVTYATSPKTGITLGEDLTSGNEPGVATPGNAVTGKNRRFDPLYGTPHKHWGLMDYFYVADGFGVGGLSDFYIKGRWKPLDKLIVTADFHQFASTNSIVMADKTSQDNPSFGQEFDLVGQYVITKQIGLEGGYSIFSSTDALAAAKGIVGAQKTNTWGYLMVNVKF